MKYGFPALSGIINDPAIALDYILEAYFYSDTTKQGIEVPTNSLRSDMVDGSNIANNIETSLNYILGCYYDVYTVSATSGEVIGNVQDIELSISVSDEGAHVSFEKILNLSDGKLKSISLIGHL